MAHQVVALDYTDPALAHASLSIQSTYGDVVSVMAKGKSLLKFGRNSSVGTSPATLMTLAGSETAESYLNNNLITHAASADAGDVGPIILEGHAISGEDLTFVVQSVTLSGQTKVALMTPLARATRGYNDGATDLVGPIYIAENVTFTAGVPSPDSAAHLIIPAAKNQSEKASSSLDSATYGIVTGFYADVLEKTAAFATVTLETREIGKTFRNRATASASNSCRGYFPMHPYFIIPPNHDFRLQAAANTAGVDVSGGVQMYLARILASGEFLDPPYREL